MDTNYWINIFENLLKQKQERKEEQKKTEDDLDYMLEKNVIGIMDSNKKPWFYDISKKYLWN